MTQKEIGIIASDMRQIYMAQILDKRGYVTSLWDMREQGSREEPRDFWQCRNFVLPVPVSRLREPDRVIAGMEAHKDTIDACYGGVFPQKLEQRLKDAGIETVDILKDPNVAIRNAVATAEGTVAELLGLMPVNMEGARVLVLGFGKCGKVIAEKLYCMGASVSVAARRTETLQLATMFGFRTYDIAGRLPLSEVDGIVNTVPAMVMDAEKIDQLSDACVIVDIASAPGGCDGEYCKQKNIPYKLALGLPGIYSPRTSAMILLDAMPFS